MEVLLLLVMGLANVICFIIGARVGQRAVQGKEIELPKIPTPAEAIRKKQERREADKEQEKIETIMANIERYDGTAMGQKDVPGR